MSEEQVDPSVEMTRKMIRDLTSLDDPENVGINWNKVAFYGGIGLFILGKSVNLVVGGDTTGYKEGVSPTRIQAKAECYHHQVQSGETVDSVLSYFRTKDSTVTKEAVLAQNGLTEENLRTGDDITYCFEKKE